MDDTTLLQIGCAVTFAALGGAYVFLEAMFEREAEKKTTPDASSKDVRVPVDAEKGGDLNPMTTRGVEQERA